MKQDVGFFDVGGPCPDLVIENGDLKADNGLETAALISLFTDKRIIESQLPLNTDNKKGWWADLISEPIEDEIGSRLWVIETNGKVNADAVIDMKIFIQEAFQWAIDDGLAKSVIASSERIENNRIEGSVNILRPDGQNIPLKFLWDGQSLKLLES